MAKEMGFQDICVEGDALIVISFIQEIKGKSHRFRSVQFKHVPREANKVVHGLAMEGWKYDGPQYWMEEAPGAVEELVNCDRNRTNGGRNDSDESGHSNEGSI
ncbi:hypothetical protein J1N35_008420 [Gossypium stocksii]|uniref:RNase H type-1 domain-containing protein n=1 Tax=Gossypium stocksii TaxID=47602 RepID=A0A9D3W8T9_9ROSI|nr:hypothetical protein J1N35_008420 [Gossypium stocksii]